MAIALFLFNKMTTSSSHKFEQCDISNKNELFCLQQIKLKGEKFQVNSNFNRNEINLVWANYFCTYGFMYNDLDCNRNNDCKLIDIKHCPLAFC